MNGMPSGQLSFMLKAGSDTLPTPMNIQRYKVQVSSHCKLCQRPQATTGHIISACPEALEQGKYTWRHDSVLQSLVRSLEKALPNGQIYADLDNMHAQEHPPATIPPNLTATSSRPDIVYINGPNITFLEQTINGNSKEAMTQARERKQQKQPYLEITNDLHRQGLNVKYDTIEIGALGHSTKDTPYHLYHTIPQVNRLQWQTILDNAGEIAIACSRSLFLARNALEWRQPLLSLSIVTSTQPHPCYNNPNCISPVQDPLFFLLFIIAILRLSSPICILASYTPCQTLFTQHCCPMYCACARGHTTAPSTAATFPLWMAMDQILCKQLKSLNHDCKVTEI